MLFAEVDRTVAAQGVRDAQTAGVAGHPYLRLSRFLAATAPAPTEGSAFDAWIERMRELDSRARHIELANLPAEVRTGLEVQTARTHAAPLNAALDKCAATLRAVDLGSEPDRAELRACAVVPSSYRSWQRVLGLYWLTRFPFAAGVRRLEATLRTTFDGPDLPDQGSRVRYVPAARTRLSPAEVRAILKRVLRNPLVRPEPDKVDAERLFAAFAPVFAVDTTGRYDHIGVPYWRSDQTLDIDTERPVVHQRFAHTLYEGRTLLQLVYTAWFPERPSDDAFDLLAGHVDGLIWRVTLTPDGEPWVFDSMHPCGCYHQFFPTARAEARAAPDDLQEWAFVPQRLPRLSRGERVTIHVATRSHYIERIAIDAPEGATTRYTLVPEDELRSLPTPAGDRRSAFGTDGLMFGTERIERFFFWPMGIPSAGAMRQWGNHATAFVGERHFDDADLFERRFRLR
jgi:hypothetical protein